MTGEQRWPSYEPKPARREPEEAPPPPVTPEPLTRVPRRRVNPTKAILLGVVPLLVVGGIVVAIVSAADDDGVPGFGKPDALSSTGLDQLRADVEERSGGTEVFRAVIYPEYAVVDVPVDPTSLRQESLYWDGDLDDFGGKGSASSVRVDLADVDAEVVAAALELAGSLVEDPTTRYVVIDGPSTSSDGPDAEATIAAYVTNEYSESGHVELDLDGTEVSRYVSGQ
ncbi:hypothetical protein [Nocardioides sp.]|uniref:hypothetical protein n=1 Tax=Nocardioides sp. TaxID=35761 RepID=UPI00271EECA6|nr:hypothetical protein [Nocardioides sp.]MDO9457123.1 hypothetical protein [Nocardioides sp.]